MFKIFIIAFLTMMSVSFGQTNMINDSLYKEFSANSRQFMDSILHPIKYARTLEEFLTSTFPINSNKDGRWVYYKEKGDVQKIEKRIISKILPDYRIYKVKLTNYLGWHMNEGTCLVFFDSIHSKLTYAEPLWYGCISKPLIKLFIGKTLNEKETFLNFLTELNELIEISSSYKFRKTSFSDTLVTFDLGYFKGESYTTEGNTTSSTINYNEDGVWRKVLITIKDFAIVRYTSINPRLSQKEIIE